MTCCLAAARAGKKAAPDAKRTGKRQRRNDQGKGDAEILGHFREGHEVGRSSRQAVDRQSQHRADAAANQCQQNRLKRE